MVGEFADFVGRKLSQGQINLSIFNWTKVLVLYKQCE